MEEKTKSSELGELRKQYKELVGKGPSPKLDADALRAKIEDLKANGSEASGDAKAEAPAKKAAAKKAPKEPTPSAPGTAFMRHPEGIGASYGGVSLEPQKDGKVLVPLQAVEELQAHGFEVA